MMLPHLPCHLVRSLSAASLLGLALSTCLLPRVAYAEETATLETEVQITEKARQLFQAGVDFMQDPDGARYGEAYRSFKAAYAESPSWKILGNLGIAAMKIERDGEAIEALETYLREGREHLEEDEIEQVERDLRTLKASVTWITISINVADAFVEDVRTPLSGAPINNHYDEVDGEVRLGIHNGRHKMTVKKEGYQPATWSFVASGADLTHAFELQPLPKRATVSPPVTMNEGAQEARRPVPTVTWVTLGAAAAFGVGAAVTGTLALGAKSDFDEENGTDKDEADRLKKKGQTLNITTDALIGAAVVSAAVATITYFTRPTVDPAADTALVIAPTAHRGGGGLFLKGSF